MRVITIVLLAVIVLPAGAQTPSPLRGRVETDIRGGDQIKAEFSWSMQERYGLDRNKNGIVDLPNSFAYVHNLPEWSAGCGCTGGDCSTGSPTFMVHFHPRVSFPPPPPVKSEEQRPGPRTPPELRGLPQLPGAPRIKTEGMAQFAALLAQKRRVSWTIEGSHLATPIHMELTGDATSACLPEGEYTVTLTASTAQANESVSQKVRVEDLLIVQLGDSYASGEGTPERRIVATLTADPPFNSSGFLEQLRNTALGYHLPDYVHVLWADDGQPHGWETVESSHSLSMGQLGARVHLSARVPKYSDFSAAHRNHYRAHRSSFSAGSQFALGVEKASQKTSVTFINLAASGAATNDGLLGSYDGRRDERFFDATVRLQPQLLELKALVGTRKIDALIISIGGNDAGFANALSALIAHESDTFISYDEIRSTVRSGNWASIENASGLLGFATKWSNIVGLDALQNQYRIIKETLEGLAINAHKVYVMQYPQIGKKIFPKPQDPIAEQLVPGGLQYCLYVLDAVAPEGWGGIDTDSEISRDELKWATTNVLNLLNEKLALAAQQNGWTLVDGILKDSEPHGLCASDPYAPSLYNPTHPVAAGAEGMRWYRRGKEAAEIQNKVPHKSSLVAHPNEFGYRAMAERLKQVVSLPED